MSVNLNQASSYLEQLIKNNSHLENFLGAIQNDFQKKLWHELTIKITEFIKIPEVRISINFLEFYEKFLKSFESKLNQLSFVRIAVHLSSSIKDIDERIQFLKKISELQKVLDNNEAHIFITATLAELYLEKGDAVQSKSILEQAKKLMDETSGADSVVHAAFHRAWAAYYKVRGDFENFYSSALQYLGYINLSFLEKNEILALARDLVTAALLGEKLFSLGELMENNILDILKSSQDGWLVEILSAFNNGNLNAWISLQKKFSFEISNSSLKDKIPQLTAKVKILSLIELVFSKPSDQRTITFETISKITDVPNNQVEILVMRALSLGLLKGTIDEVNQRVFFTWVQPRILNLQQISKMRERLEIWVDSVKQSLNLVENETTTELIS